jgi:ADP-ribose pyrophosphatase YjhB (NUDIX family)
MSAKPGTEFKQDSHCGYCGVKFLEQITWPRKCFICWNESYKNPVPVVVSMIPVRFGKPFKTGLLQQRNIEPEKGNFGLSGGHINYGETWQEAIVRENEEEMHFYSCIDDYKLWEIKTSSNGHMVIFCTYRKVFKDQVEQFIERFIPNEEVQALGIYHKEDWSCPRLPLSYQESCADLFLSEIRNNVHFW